MLPQIRLEWQRQSQFVHVSSGLTNLPQEFLTRPKNDAKYVSLLGTHGAFDRRRKCLLSQSCFSSGRDVPFPFMELPPELHQRVYHYLWEFQRNYLPVGVLIYPHWKAPIYLVSRALYHEISGISDTISYQRSSNEVQN